MTLTIDRELARWSRKDGSTAVWHSDKRLNVRIGPRGKYRPCGRPLSLAGATRALKRIGGGWRRYGGASKSKRWDRYHPPPQPVTEGMLRGCVESRGLYVRLQGTLPPGAKLARIAVYALRAETIEVQTPVDFNSPMKHNSRRSLFDEPLTLGEIAAALTDPAALSGAAEREAATEAMFGRPSDDAEDGGDEGDD